MLIGTSVDELLVHVLHQPDVLGVVHRNIDQNRYRLLQGLPQDGSEVLGVLDRVALRAKGLGELDDVVVAKLDPRDPSVVGLLLELHHVVRVAVPNHVHEAAAHPHRRLQLRRREQKAPVP